MAILHRITVSAPSCIYSMPGCFRIFEPDERWIQCREVFHHEFQNKLNANNLKENPKDVSFFYWEDRGTSWGSRDTPQLKNIIRIITEAEDVLKVKIRAEFWNTNRLGIICCNPGKWWSDPVHLNVMTILFRYANDQSLKDLIETSPFTQIKSTKKYLKLFFTGNTFFHEDIFRGWVRTCNDRNFRETLLKSCPPKKDEIQVVFSKGRKLKAKIWKPNIDKKEVFC